MTTTATKKKSPKAKPPTVGFVSLGCPKAASDAEQILTRLRAEGYEISGGYSDADLVVVNTCGFIDAAKKDSVDTLLAAADLKRSGPARAVVAVGCMAQRYGRELADASIWDRPATREPIPDPSTLRAPASIELGRDGGAWRRGRSRGSGFPVPGAAVAAAVVVLGLVGYVVVRERTRDPVADPARPLSIPALENSLLGQALGPGTTDTTDTTAPPATALDPIPAEWSEVWVETPMPAGWVLVPDADAGFQVALPATPVVQDLSPPGSGRSYQAKVDDGLTAVVTWFPVAPDPGAPVSDRLLGAIDRITAGRGPDTRATSVPVRFRGLPAANLRVRSPSENTLALCALHRDHLVCAGLTGSNVDLAALAGLVNSLRFD